MQKSLWAGKPLGWLEMVLQECCCKHKRNPQEACTQEREAACSMLSWQVVISCLSAQNCLSVAVVRCEQSTALVPALCVDKGEALDVSGILVLALALGTRGEIFLDKVRFGISTPCKKRKKKAL